MVLHKLVVILCFLCLSVFVTVYIFTSLQKTSIEYYSKNFNISIFRLNKNLTTRPSKQQSQHVKLPRPTLKVLSTRSPKKIKPTSGDIQTIKVTKNIQTFLHYASVTTISDEDRKVYRDLIKIFTDFCDKKKLTYFITSGTLIGSYRHHGFVPWDDDFDVYFDYADRNKIKHLFTEETHRKEKLVLKTEQGMRWKIYLDIPAAKKAGNYPFKWPYIDLCFFRTDNNSSTLHDSSSSSLKFNKNDVYPLSRRPFEGMMLRAPRCASGYLGGSSGEIMKKCCPNNWHHKDEHGLTGSDFCIACNLLRGRFPFVQRVAINSTLFNETLYLGEKVIGSILQTECQKS